MPYKREADYLRMIAAEKKRINKELNDSLYELVERGESLLNYQVWVNKKCEIMIETDYIIDIIPKNMKKEGFKRDIVYAIVKIESE